MPGTRTALVVGLVVAVLAVAGCGGDDEATATDTETVTTLPETLPAEGAVLKGSVGPGFDISLSTEDGQAVETLAAGSYTLEVDDQSDIHNFHLTGTGVDVKTDVGATGVESFDVTVEAGTYTFVCDPHAGSMNGSFEVTG
ncbi:MAG: Copper-bind protein [Thermoleophilia bacterium]|nr:Copper-bind protein [Thermoleophilia bacterium]